jgi:flavin-dependent dehydrogenase
MGLWDDFLTQGHSPAHGGRSVWGGSEPAERDSLRDLDGPGWHLDRSRFDDWLRAVAVQRGAALLTPAHQAAITRAGDSWGFDLIMDGRTTQVRTRLLVDATGRSAAVARGFGSRRTSLDRLVCGWLHGTDRTGRQAGLTHIEAEPDGWWYTAPLPGNRRVVAFHTDADLPSATVAASGPDAMLHRVSSRAFFASVLADSGFSPNGEGGFCAAHGSVLAPPVGDSWLAVGDAALGFDPLSSQGLFNALYTGLAAAWAVDRHLSGDTIALRQYQSTLAAIHDAYRTHLHAWYGLERRWTRRPFWQRRLGSGRGDG